MNYTIININEYLYTSNEYCLKYLTSDTDKNNTFIDLEKIISNDWILKMSADNIKNYYEIFKEKNRNNIYDILIDYSFIYFLTGITLLIINFFVVHYFNMLDEADDFEDITPKDFTILVHGVKKQKIPRKEYLMNLINEISNNYFKLEIHQIISCFNLVELYKLTKKVFEDRTKIYHARNLKRQRDLNDKNKLKIKIQEEQSDTKVCNTLETTGMNVPINILIRNQSQISMLTQSKKNNFNPNYENINYYYKFLCFKKATPLNEIQEKINKNKEKIMQIERDISQNPNKYNCGTYFIVFKYIKMRDQIYQFFPTTLSCKIYYQIKYFFQNILFSKLVSEKTKRLNFLKTSFKVEHATEAYEVLWKNMGYTTMKKYLYLLLSIFVTIVLVCITLCIVLIFNHIQYNITEKKSKNFWKYLLSFLISIFISITNSLGRLILEKVTSNFETIETRTGYYISLSAKISFFTFINTAIVPLLSNYIREEWGNNELLLNNVLMIFITNITLTPFFFYVGPNLCLKLSRRAKARLDLEGIPWEDSPYTQGELNEIFENPKMDLCYKYSFFSNVVLTSFFYLSILPLGIVFSIFGLIVSYFLEIVHLQFYKRPEVLNSKLCKFFINHFNVALAVFALGNFIFLRDAEKNFSPDWNLINLILFIIIMFIPYHGFKINLLGIKEGEVTKGSYDEYELMFPTDYEKQNPLTKKKAMIKYFKKLRKMNEIDDIQSNFLINSINKESSMVNYYKTSRNVGNILNYYEFQNQFVRLQKRSKYIKEAKLRKRKINKYDIFINQKARERRATLLSMNTLPNNRMRSSSKKTKNNINNNINNNPPALDRYNSNNDLDDYSNLGYNKQYKIKGLMESNPKFRRRISSHMRSALIQNIKEQGLYSATEEDSDDDEESFISEGTSKITSNLNLRNSNKKSFDKFKEDEKN